MIPYSTDTETENVPDLNYGFIIVNYIVAINLFIMTEKSKLLGKFMTYGLISGRFIAHPDLDNIMTLFTSMFMHGSWSHLIGNMWFLWLFGGPCEDRMGKGKFFVFYILCGLAAAATQMAFIPHAKIPMIGASGAISGVMGAYLCLYPFGKVKIWWGFMMGGANQVYFSAWFFLIFWFAYQFLDMYIAVQLAHMAGTSIAKTGGVAWFAHIGGFVAGVILVWFFKNPKVEKVEKKEDPDEPKWIRVR